MAVNATANQIYVSGSSNGNLVVLDGVSNAILSTTPLNNPTGIALNVAGDRIYVGSGGNTLKVLGSTPPNSTPTASAGVPYTVAEGGSVVLSGSGSDADGDPLTYTWDLNNDGSFETTGQTPTFSAAGKDGPGSQTVTLKVCDSKGACGTTSATIPITNVAPTITSVTNTGPILAGASATISITASDPAGAADPLLYEFDCDDNGAYEVGPQASASTPCLFPQEGSRRVSVRVSDSDGGTASGSTTVTVNPAADLAVAISATPDPAQRGKNLTYSITVTNAGPSTAPGVSLTDTLPSGTTFVSISPSQGSCSGTSSVSCSLGTLTKGASATVTLVVRPPTSGTITNTASVTSAVADPVAANNAASHTTTIATPSETTRLTVVVQGQGKVVSAPAGIDCPNTCAGNYASGTTVTLTASGESGWVFGHWEGACAGSTTTTCQVTLTAGLAVRAVFTRR